MFLARVSMHLPIDTPLPRQSEVALSLQEAIEHRATAWGIPVDARIERGRTYRHALRQTFEHERYDRIVLAAAARGSTGFDAGDVAWLLDNATGEIVVFTDATTRVAANALSALTANFADPAVGAVAPRIVPYAHGPGWLSRRR